MLGRKSRPMIGKIITGDRSGQPDFSTSPKSPLEFKIWSPRNLINYDTKKVGLGILADLGESGENFARKPFSGRNFNRSDPIPVKKIAEPKKDFEEIEMDSLEDYTFVTCHGPKKSYTKVYGRNGEERENVERERFLGGEIRKRVSLFNISPIRFGDFPANPTSDFLSSCCLCKKKLHGKDIFMYRGEKAFCSTECRYRQITIDERKEKCRSEASRSVDVSNSPCTNQGSFLTGILAI